MNSEIIANESILRKVKVVSKIKLSDEIALQIRKLIETGKLQPSDKLPNERELAKAFQVSRTTVREAIKSLEHESILKTYPGSGTCVVDVKDASFDLVFQSMSRKNLRLTELYVLRRIVEPQIAGIAAQDAISDDIALLESLYEKQQKLKAEDKLLVDFDYEFHIQIAKSTRNQLLLEVLKWIVDFFRDNRPIAMRSAENYNELLEGHEQILKAIKEKNSKKAELSMRKHLHAVEDLALNKH
jgi:GntR family transcriptional regulator, transcriptional repressor for pyruvate dehydrogenase complex